MANGDSRRQGGQKETKRQRAYRMANEPAAPVAPSGPDIGAILAEQEAAMAAQRQAFMEQMAEMERQASIRAELADMNRERMEIRTQLPGLSVAEYTARQAYEDAKKKAAQAEAAKVTGGGRGSVDLSPFETEYQKALNALNEARRKIDSIQGSILGRAGEVGESDYYNNLFSQDTDFDPESYIAEQRSKSSEASESKTKAATATATATQAASAAKSSDNILAGMFSGSSGLEENGRKSTNRIF